MSFWLWFDRTFETPLRWSSLRGWGNSSLLRTSWIWLVVIPIAAKSLDDVSGEYVLPLFGNELTVHVGLPFRWATLFFIALAFFIGETFYKAGCPGIIRDFSSFEEFKGVHPGVVNLAYWLSWLSERMPIRAYFEHVMQTIEEIGRRHAVAHVEFPSHELTDSLGSMCDNLYKDDMAHYEMEELLERAVPLAGSIVLEVAGDQASVGDVLEVIQEQAEATGPALRRATFVFFALGAALFGWLLLENVWWVLHAITSF